MGHSEGCSEKPPQLLGCSRWTYGQGQCSHTPTYTRTTQVPTSSSLLKCRVSTAHSYCWWPKPRHIGLQSGRGQGTSWPVKWRPQQVRPDIGRATPSYSTSQKIKNQG